MLTYMDVYSDKGNQRGLAVQHFDNTVCVRACLCVCVCVVTI